MGIVGVLLIFLRSFLRRRAGLAAENLALRQQLVVLQRSVPHPKLRRCDRFFWVWLSQLWRGWRSTLLIVQLETVVRWHQQGFRLYWRWKSRRRGRPSTGAELRRLIRRISQENRVLHRTHTKQAESVRRMLLCDNRLWRF